MVKCDKCGKETSNYYDVDGNNICLSCYTDLSEGKFHIEPKLKIEKN